MNIFNDLKEVVHTVVYSLYPGTEADLIARLTVEPPRDPSHGDMATNAAMILSKSVGAPPRTVAENLVQGLNNHDMIVSCEVAGPGFINMRLKPDAWKAIIPSALQAGTDQFGRSEMGKDTKINVEYVSANPTGPLTAAHARGAIYGDALANLLVHAGYDVNREYYTNDAGRQVEVLTDSVWLRYREALGEDIGKIPAGCYPGEYLKDVANALIEAQGKGLTLKTNREDIKKFAIDTLMEEIKRDLGDLGVHQNMFVSEAEILASGAVQDAMDKLTKLGLIYEGVLEPPKGKKPDDWEEREQTLFKSTDYGDDVDRPLKKSDGSTTYFANDIAHYYYMAKMGYAHMINVVGADHGGYVKRAKAAVKAITAGETELNLPLVAIVHVTDNGQPVRMSKRAGTFVTLRDVLDKVGAGVMRFIMLTRSSDQTLEFDIAKAVEQSKDNPYFYVQYAHARCCSVLRHADEMFANVNMSDTALAKIDLSPLDRPEELDLVRLIATWPRVIEQAATAQEPHRIAYFAQDVASAFHAWWNRGKDDTTLRFLDADNRDLTLARVALVRTVALTLSSALGVVGVEPLQELRNDEDSEAA